MSKKYDDEDMLEYAYAIKKVNKKRIKKLKRKAIIKTAVFVMGLMIIPKLASGNDNFDFKIKFKDINLNGDFGITSGDEFGEPIPEGYSKVYIDEFVDYGETLEDIANKYYTDNIATIYPDLNEYMDNIINKNDIKYNVINKYDSIKVPVIVENDNYYLNEIDRLTKEIKNLDEWVPYTIMAGDTISELAWKGAGTADEAINNTSLIINNNNVDPSNLQIGQTIYIINPEIGELKRQINDLYDQFIPTVTNSNSMTR